MKVIGKNGTFPVTGVAMPRRAYVGFDVPPDTTGRCGEFIFAAGCVLSGSGGTVSCKQRVIVPGASAPERAEVSRL